jgi:hypothetical protein
MDIMEYTKNTNPHYYEENEAYSNCGSFAFNVEEWYDPESDFEIDVGYVGDWIVEMVDNGFSCDEVADIYAEKLAESVLNDFFGEVREILFPWQVKDNEELIAFRGYCRYETNEDSYPDYDFHFKVFRNGIWQEKCGRHPVKFCTEDDWTYMTRTYNSYTIYFAHLVN